MAPVVPHAPPQVGSCEGWHPVCCWHSCVDTHLGLFHCTGVAVRVCAQSVHACGLWGELSQPTLGGNTQLWVKVDWNIRICLSAVSSCVSIGACIPLLPPCVGPAGCCPFVLDQLPGMHAGQLGCCCTLYWWRARVLLYTCVAARGPAVSAAAVPCVWGVVGAAQL
jgi:hypothetical protein